MTLTTRTLRACFILSTLAAGLAPAADISIGKNAAAKDAISLTGLSATGPRGRVFLAVLMSDLERSGWFKVESSAGTKVTGTAMDAGASVQVSSTVTAPGRGFQYMHGGLPDARREAHLFADEIVKRLKGVNGIASTHIVMVRRSGNGADVFTCDADGRNVMQVTHDNSYCIMPRWTPDSRHVYYTGYFTGRPCAYRIDTTTGQRQTLSDYLGLNAGATVAPNGADVAIVLSYPGNPELFLMRLGSGALTRLTRTHQAAEASPSWSPDGRQLAYVSDATSKAQVYVMDMASKQSRRLTFRGSENLSPNWGKDGRIAYMTRRAGRYQIAVIDPRSGESSGEFLSDGPDEDPSWAPDNRHIVCSRSSGIYILDTLGDPPVRLLSLSGEWVSPDWSER